MDSNTDILNHSKHKKSMDKRDSLGKTGKELAAKGDTESNEYRNEYRRLR
jgi:hypothetical protein